MLLGADTMRPALQALDLDIDAERRERFSQLSYAGPIKITKLPKRSAVVAFSAEEVYAIAELLKRQRGGCAVIMGALSPRTRNAQVALYQSGEVDYIVATDAIGMGLNLDVQHIAFASRGKFDGTQTAAVAGGRGRADRRTRRTLSRRRHVRRNRRLPALRRRDHRAHRRPSLRADRNAELAQFQPRLVEHRRACLPRCAGRRPTSSCAARPRLWTRRRSQPSARSRTSAGRVRSSAHVRRLWDLCTLPDFRKTGADAHLKLVGAFLEKLAEPDARLKDAWMYEQVERLNQDEGGIDILQQRLAAHPHLDLCGQSVRLGRERRDLARPHARDRGPAVGCAARTADAALRRPPHVRAAENSERRGRNRRRSRRRGTCGGGRA